MNAPFDRLFNDLVIRLFFKLSDDFISYDIGLEEGEKIHSFAKGPQIH